jgi:hypothetical protein
MTIGMIYGWATHMTWWSVIIAFLIAFAWAIPIGIVQAVTNIQLGLNVFTEFIIGYASATYPHEHLADMF